MSAASSAAGPVLVTGGAGFLGSRLVARLLAAGREVVVLDDLSTGSAARLPQHPRLALHEASVLDAAAVRRAARGAAAVWHLASVVGMQRAVRLPAHALAVSEQGTRHVLDATGDAPVVLVSSSAVYGLRHADPAREDRPPEPADVLAYDGGVPGYACGKLALERQGLEAAAGGRRVLVVRPFNVVGCGQSPAYGMVLPGFVQRALAGRELLIHGDGRQTRAFSGVDAFTDALLRLARSAAAWHAPQPVFNLGSPAPTSVLELARLVCDTCDADVPLRFVPYEEAYPGRRDVPARSPDVTRLSAEIGEVAWPGVAEIVREVVLGARAAALRLELRR